MENNLSNRLIAKAKEIYKDEGSGHDISHIGRVLNFCQKINATENANWDIIFISALYHDIHRVLSNKCGHFISAEESINDVHEILREFDLDEKLLKEVLYVVYNHDNKKMNPDEMSKELQIVQDADILDTLGENGIKRTLKYCQRHKIPVTNKNYSLDCEEYIPDVNPISTTHYVSRTMIPQASLLHTDSAKELANEQINILESFIEDNIKSDNISNYDWSK